MSKMGFINAANPSSFIGEQSVSAKANQYSSDPVESVPQATQKLNMSMFGAPTTAPSMRTA